MTIPILDLEYVEAMNNAQGGDYSLWDGGPGDNLQVIDWEANGRAWDFAVIKVSEGTVEDPLFRRQWDAARTYIVRQAYHFWREWVDAKAAAQKVVSILGGDAGELPVALDLEDNQATEAALSKAKVWVDEYHRLTGLWPEIYSTFWWLIDHGSGRKTILGTFKNAWLLNCKLWIAQYPFDSIDKLDGYTEMGDALRAVLIQEVIDGRRQLTWPIAPWPWAGNQVGKWQWSSRYPPGQTPGYYTGPNGKDAVDHNWDVLSKQVFRATYPIGDIPVPEPPVAYIVRRSLADYEIGFTQGEGALLLKDAVTAATENGWEAAMNGGAGFDYTDATHAIPKVDGFEKVQGIPYARRLIQMGVVNPALDTLYKAPWCVLGFDALTVYLVVTRGKEGEDGMTQAGAAQYVKSLGCVEAYLMDSGRSAQIEEYGAMLYWPYGPSEKVPQHIGLKRRTMTGGNVKGVARSATNIKATVAGQTPAVAQLAIGQYVYGTLVGAAATGDLVGFSHFYTAAGVKVELGVVCKAYAGNLTLTNEAEPGDVPPPPPPPTGDTFSTTVEFVHKDKDGNVLGTYRGSADLIKQP